MARLLIADHVIDRLSLQLNTRYVGQWTTQTAADGTFQLRGMPYGVYVVIMRTQGRVVYQNKVSLYSASQQVNVDLRG
jgi:hypothetical protein